VHVGQLAPLEQLLFGPSSTATGEANLMGALRRSMATTGYSDVKEFQRVDVVVAPYSAR
jgi:IMP dehydrogenase